MFNFSSKVQGFNTSKVQGFKSSGVQGFKGSKVQGFKSSRVQRFNSSKVQGLNSSRAFVMNYLLASTSESGWLWHSVSRRLNDKTYKKNSSLFFLTAIFFLSIAPLSIKAQGSISYYPFNNYLGLSTNPDKTLWVETRFVLNSLTNSLVTEIGPMVTISRSHSATYYLGGGINMYPLKAFDSDNVLNAYYLCGGVRAYPFEKAQRVAVNFELSPLAYKKFDLGNFRAFLGISYRFGNRKDFKLKVKN